MRVTPLSPSDAEDFGVCRGEVPDTFVGAVTGDGTDTGRTGVGGVGFLRTFYRPDWVSEESSCEVEFGNGCRYQRFDKRKFHLF